MNYDKKQQLKIDNSNKKKYRKTIINIDSKFRNQVPKNILDNIHYLNNNPLFFINNTSEIIIHDTNHGFIEEDRIIINSINGQTFYLTNTLIFNNNDPYITIFHPNHNILDLISSQIYSDIYINIQNIIGN